MALVVPHQPGAHLPFDLARIRRDFPILKREVAPGVPLVYLDNAATSQKPVQVIAELTRFYRDHNANIHRGVHTLSVESTELYEGAREKTARFIGCTDAREVIFTRNTTESINLVARAWGRKFLQAGDEVVVSEIEHHSNIVPWQMLRDRRGLVLKALPVTVEGRIDLSALASLVTKKTRLIALAHCSNVTGAVADLAKVVDAAKSVGAAVLVDGAQRVPHGPLDIPALGVDFYAFSGHKMYAPHGIGVLWGRRERLEAMPPFLGGGDMIRHVTIEKTDRKSTRLNSSHT